MTELQHDERTHGTEISFKNYTVLSKNLIKYCLELEIILNNGKSVITITINFLFKFY